MRVFAIQSVFLFGSIFSEKSELAGLLYGPYMIREEVTIRVLPMKIVCMN